jgi:hypothetical protein
VKRSLSKAITGSVAYTYSKTTREAWDPATERRTTVRAQFDRPHVVNAVLSWRLPAGWQIGGRYVAYSGVPYSSRGNLALPDARTPPFHRLDLRVEKRWRIGEGRSLALTAEVFNALLMKEAIGIKCTAIDECHPEEIGPITIPSIGFEGTL